MTFPLDAAGVQQVAVAVLSLILLTAGVLTGRNL